MAARQVESNVASDRNLYETGKEIVRNSGLRVPDRFWTDPATQEEGAVSAETQAQQQLAAQQQQLAQLQAQLQQQQQQIERERNLMQHEREVLKIQLSNEQAQRKDETQREKISNDLTVALEKLQNQLTELELKFSENVPGSKV